MPPRMYSDEEKQLIHRLNNDGLSPTEIAIMLEESNYSRNAKQISGWLYEERQRDKDRPWLAFGDFHAPYQHRNALSFLKAVKERYNCRDHVYCTGDLFDFHSMSRFTTESDAPSPDEEYERALEFVGELARQFPMGTLVLGNHDRIPQRGMKEAGLSDVVLKGNNELYGLPDTWTVEPLHAVIAETDTLVEHGIGSNGVNGAINTAIAKESNYIQGHTHSFAGAFTRSNHRGLRWALNTGCLANNKSLAMRYGRYAKNQGVLGCGLIWPENGLLAEHPQFVPMAK